MKKALKVNTDERGSFTELCREDWLLSFIAPHDIGEPPTIKQSMMSISNRGVIRAWHKHKRGQDDLLVVIKGKARIVYVNEITKRFVEREVSELKPELIYIPGDHWHGTQALTGTTTIYFVTKLYDYENPDELRLPPDHDFGWGTFGWEK